MLRTVLQVWSLSLMLSVVLVAAGERWPQSLAVQPLLVAGLVLGPALLMLAWIVAQWSVGAPQPSGAGDGGESQQPEAMNP